MEAPRSTRMLGSPIVTTRLSRVTMKSAIEGIANVQMVVALALISFSLVSSHSLAVQKNTSTLPLQAAFEEVVCPGPVEGADVPRGGPVDPQPDASSILNLLPVLA